MNEVERTVSDHILQSIIHSILSLDMPTYYIRHSMFCSTMDVTDYKYVLLFAEKLIIQHTVRYR